MIFNKHCSIILLYFLDVLDTEVLTQDVSVVDIINSKY